MELEQDVQELRLAEQGIYRQALDAKAERIEELEAEVTYLRRLLNDAMAVPRLAPAVLAAAAPVKTGPFPRRWRA